MASPGLRVRCAKSLPSYKVSFRLQEEEELET
jgi:hypothetical protein